MNLDEFEISVTNIRSYLKGEHSLSSAVIFYIGGLLSVYGIIVLTTGFIDLVFEPDGFFNWLNVKGGMKLLLIPYELFGFWIIWKCSVNAKNKLWFYVSRLFVISCILTFPISIYEVIE